MALRRWAVHVLWLTGALSTAYRPRGHATVLRALSLAAYPALLRLSWSQNGSKALRRSMIVQLVRCLEKPMWAPRSLAWCKTGMPAARKAVRTVGEVDHPKVFFRSTVKSAIVAKDSRASSCATAWSGCQVTKSQLSTKLSTRRDGY